MARGDRRAFVIAAVLALTVAVSVPREASARSGLPVTDPTGTARAPENTATAAGIDVGDYQHSKAPIRWRIVARQYQFAFVKATEGTHYVNRYYRSDRRSALAAGLYVGAYAFATPDDASGAAEANYFLQHSGYSMGRKLLFPMVDLEYDPYNRHTPCYGLDRTAMISWITSYSAAIYGGLGVRPIIYTQASWWNLCTGGTSAFNGHPLWVGSNGRSAALPAGFTAWSIWQSGVGVAAGVRGPVDVDAFNGTVAQLRSRLTNPNAKPWRQNRPGVRPA